MDNREERNKILSLLERMRSITLAVQVIPFVYTFLYIIVLILYLFASESVLQVLDSLLYVSPIVVIAFLVESRILKLCKWHKTACLLPLFPQISLCVDRFIYEFSSQQVVAHLLMLSAMAILLLVAAYKVFLSPRKDERSRRTH